jgi:hypothetical protein
MPDYLPLSDEKATACQILFECAGRIRTLFESQLVQSSASMQASLDDLLGAVYSLVYARNHDYDDRQHALDPKDIQAVSVRALDISKGKVRTEGKWTAGFYFNNALFRIAAIYHRALKIATEKETEGDYVGALLPEVERKHPKWKNANLMKIHRQVNDLKHTADGVYQGRDVKFNEAVCALDELLSLIEARKQSDTEPSSRTPRPSC